MMKEQEPRTERPVRGKHMMVPISRRKSYIPPAHHHWKFKTEKHRGNKGSALEPESLKQNNFQLWLELSLTWFDNAGEDA